MVAKQCCFRAQMFQHRAWGTAAERGRRWTELGVQSTHSMSSSTKLALLVFIPQTRLLWTISGEEKSATTKIIIISCNNLMTLHKSFDHSEMSKSCCKAVLNIYYISFGNKSQDCRVIHTFFYYYYSGVEHYQCLTFILEGNSERGCQEPTIPKANPVMQ